MTSNVGLHVREEKERKRTKVAYVQVVEEELGVTLGDVKSSTRAVSNGIQELSWIGIEGTCKKTTSQRGPWRKSTNVGQIGQGSNMLSTSSYEHTMEMMFQKSISESKK